MLKRIVCSGFGGQGILTTGILIAYAGFESDYRITWYPSYGSEMRGGTANCIVKLSDEEIASPYVQEIDILLTLNEPAIDKFEPKVAAGGWLFVNAPLVNPDRAYRDDIKVVKVDAEGLAAKAGNSKGANIAMLGAVLKTTGLFSLEAYETAMTNYFTEKGKEKFNKLNSLALRHGYDSV